MLLIIIIKNKKVNEEPDSYTLFFVCSTNELVNSSQTTTNVVLNTVNAFLCYTIYTANPTLLTLCIGRSLLTSLLHFCSFT